MIKNMGMGFTQENRKIKKFITWLGWALVPKRAINYPRE